MVTLNLGYNSRLRELRGMLDTVVQTSQMMLVYGRGEEEDEEKEAL